MRAFLFLLLIFSLIHSADFGYSRIELERVWTIEVSEPGAEIDFQGLLVFNDSIQSIYHISTEPEMTIEEDENGGVRLLYEDTLEETSIDLKGTVLVELYYDTALLEDPPLEGAELNYTPLIEPNEEIIAQAQELKAGTTLETIRRLANWVNQNLKYDIRAGGQGSAQDAFRNRRGVCVEYSHLFGSMARSLGIDTRYVSGYVMVNDAWQAHAWSEAFVPGYGWLPVDPTFGEVGALDNSHLIIGYGLDQESLYDSVYSNKPNTQFSVEDSLDIKLTSEDAHGLETGIDFQRDLLSIDVTTRNTKNEYQFATYSFIAPEDYGGEQTEVILLAPFEERHHYYSLNNSLFQEGYQYSIPIRVVLNDAGAEKEIRISKSVAEEPAETAAETTTCMFQALIMTLVLFIASIIAYRREM